MAEEKDEIIENLEQVEQVLNQYARKIAHDLHVRDDIFTIHLVRKMKRGDMEVIPGPHVEIFLLWPAVQPILNSKLKSAFRLIKTRNVYTPLAVATHAYFVKEQGEVTKWVKQKLGKDIADSIISLVPKHRLQVITTIVTEVKDTLTGASVLGSVQRIGDHRDAPTSMWSVLSQSVIDQFPDTMAEDNEVKLIPAPPETPELDNVMAQFNGYVELSGNVELAENTLEGKTIDEVEAMILDSLKHKQEILDNALESEK